jgi:hypothetical protein
MHMELRAVGRRDPARLLSAVLKGVKPQISEVRCLRVPPDSKNTTHRDASLAFFAADAFVDVALGRARIARIWGLFLGSTIFVG